MIYLPRGKTVREKVNPARINLPEAMDKLRVGAFTGYLRFDSPQGTGLVIFEKGKLVSALFAENEEQQRLIAYDAIARIFEISISGQAILNIFKLSNDLALNLHVLLHGQYLLRGAELKGLDIDSMLQRIKEDQLTGCVRVYTEERVVLIFYEVGMPLGFFHDGGTDLESEANLSRSVARLPGAKVDLVEMQSSTDLVLADLMASADLGPIWQRSRKVLLEERRKREEALIRSLQEEQDLRRQRILDALKKIAAEYIGKMGISQVEKAFAPIDSEVSSNDLALFYDELERLAKLVAGPKKISGMLEEMKRQFPPAG